MSDDVREVIPDGKQPLFSYRHLVPVAKFLIEERGHYPFPPSRSVVSFEWGFRRLNGLRCQLTRWITQDDWAAINERFVVPDTIGYNGGIIQDNLNYVYIEGFEQIMSEDGVIPIEEWEVRRGLR